MIIKVKNIRCETFVGIYDEERAKKQPLLVNIKIEYDAGNSPKSDDVADTLNYHPIVDRIKTHIEENSFHLLEKAVEDIGDIIMGYSKVTACKVEIAKIAGPIKFIDSFSVTKNFRRETA